MLEFFYYLSYEPTHIGTGDLTLPVARVSGNGFGPLTGSGALALQKPFLQQEIIGQYSAPLFDGDSALPFGVTLASIVVEGVGVYTPAEISDTEDSGDLVLGAIVVAGVGQYSPGVASVGLTLGAVVVAGVGVYEGPQAALSADFTLGAIVVDGVGTATVPQFDEDGASLSLPDMTMLGAGRLVLMELSPAAYFPMAVDQPQAGNTYPFLEADLLLTRIVADLYLGYEDAGCEFVRPFRIKWLAGFGPAVVARPGGVPAPVWPFDMAIVDANDAVVFSTVTATSFTETPWGDRFFVMEWRNGRDILRVARYAKSESLLFWNTIETYIVPTLSTLHERSLDRRPPRLTGVLVGEDLLDAHIEFVSGYNVSLAIEEAEVADGGRRVTRVTINGVPNAGMGLFPGCEDTDSYIRTINGQRADDNGDFFFDGDGCFRVAPLTLALVEDDEVNYASVTAHNLHISQDCEPCCSCVLFANVYRVIQNQDTRQRGILATMMGVIDVHTANLERWNIQRECRLDQPLKITASPQCPCILNLSVAFCNYEDDCLADLRLDVDVATTGEMPDGGPLVCGTENISSGIRGGDYSATGLLGGYPNYRVYWAKVDPGGAAILKFSLKFDCEAGDTVTITARAYRGITLAVTEEQTFTLLPLPASGACGSCDP